MKNIFLLQCISILLFCLTCCDNSTSNQIKESEAKKNKSIANHQLASKADSAIRKRQKVKAKLLINQKQSQALYTANDYIKIANEYFDLEKDSEAEESYKKALILLNSQREKNHKILSYVYYKVGHISFIHKNWGEAISYFEKSWTEIEKYKPDSDSIISVSNKLSLSYYMTKKIKKSLKFALIAYNEQKKKYGDNLQTGLYASGVGASYDKLKQKNEAIKYLTIAHKIFLKNRSNAAERILKQIKRLKAK